MSKDRRDEEMEKGSVKIDRSDVIDVVSVRKDVSWSELTKRLNDNDKGFIVDHYHGILRTENGNEIFRDIVHIDADTGAMNSTLMGVGDELPSDFHTLRADEWHE